MPLKKTRKSGIRKYDNYGTSSDDDGGDCMYYFNDISKMSTRACLNLIIRENARSLFKQVMDPGLPCKKRLPPSAGVQYLKSLTVEACMKPNRLS